MKLYEITAEVRALEAMLEDDSADPESFGKALDALQLERDAKLANIGLLVKEIRADIQMRKDLIKTLQERNKAAENRVSWLSRYAMAHLENAVKTPLVTLSKQKGRMSLRVSEEAQLPDRFYRKEVNKSALREALEDGEAYHGVTLERGDDFLVIR